MRSLSPSHKTSTLCRFQPCPMGPPVLSSPCWPMGPFINFRDLPLAYVRVIRPTGNGLIHPRPYETNLNQEVNFLFHRGSYSWSRSMYLCLPSNPWMSEEIDFFNCLVNVESDKGIWMVCPGISGLAVVLHASSCPCDFSCPFISVSSSLGRKGYVTRNYFIQPSIVAKQKRNLKKKPTNCSLPGGIPRYTFRYLAAKPGQSANVLPWVWNPANPASKLLTSLPC